MGLIQTAHAYNIELCAEKKESVAKVRIGGNAASTGDKFVPNINMSKWDDEHWINLNLPIAIANQVETYDGKKVSIAVGDNSFNYYPANENDLEFEIVFGRKPTLMELSLNIIDSGNLDYLYQPALTQAEIDDGHNRPDNVVGAYAVCARKMNNKYCTGIFCHFYYPYLKDADGKIVRVDGFDISDGKMTVILPTEWMATAKYPVILDPTVGYSTAGASSWATTDKCSVWSQATSTGTTNNFHVALAAVGATTHGKMGLYGPIDSDGAPWSHTRMEQSAEKTDLTVSDDNSAVASGITITSGQYYAVAWCAEDASTAIKYTSGASGVGHFNTPNYTNEMIDPYAAGGDAWTYKFSLWVDYTVTGGGLGAKRQASSTGMRRRNIQKRNSGLIIL
jgi:hypothetical protein